MQTVILDEHQSCYQLQENWLDSAEADNYFKILSDDISWQEEYIPMFNKLIKVPRKVAWYGDHNAVYRYSDIEHHPLPWLPLLAILKQRLMDELKLNFNSVLANFYKDGTDYMGWHCDAEKELGKFPIIASISLGYARRFEFRHKFTKHIHKITLTPGSLLIMRGPIQHYWQHRLPKMTKVYSPRINLTFRNIITSQHPVI